MMSGIRTPVTGRVAGAGAGGAQVATSTAKTPPSATAGTSSAVAPATSPSRIGQPAQVLDAAKTFIRRPERKRRSVDLMDAYKLQTNTFATSSTDKLLQEVMKTFEDIPTRVQGYPQMRKDIKIFLETQSDKCLRTLFELSKRVKSLETAPGTVPPLTNTKPTPPELSDDILGRLKKVESNLETRLIQLEEKVAKVTSDIKEEINESGADLHDKIGDQIEELSIKVEVGQGVLELRIDEATRDVKEAVKMAESETKNEVPSYASVTAARPVHRPALHSMAVTFEGSQETADEVLARVKEAVDARGTGLKISKVRKAKNQTVILGCDTEEEFKRVKDRIESRGKGLVVAPMVNKNPLVVLKDVFLDSSDDEMVKALYSQNEQIFRDLEDKETDMTIKYKKRTRNPKTAHVVVQVRPTVWQRMTEAGALYLDLQRVRVEDQSPLIQCTKCLAYGHGRKFCTEGADRCSHCGGPHLREKCSEFLAGNEPQCCNCLHSKLTKTDHNAFSIECPVRKKWDYLARTTTAYA